MKIEIFQGVDGQWYLRVKASNGRTIAGAGEGYKTVRNATVAAHRLTHNLHRARIVVL